MTIPFKDKFSFEKRNKEATTIRAKHPDRIPVIVEKSMNSDIQEIDKTKYLAPCRLTLGQFVYIIRRRMKLPPEKALFVFIRNHIPTQSTLLSSIYEDFADEDGFLYVTYASENTFGTHAQ